MTWATRALELEGKAGHAPERTGRDGYEGKGLDDHEVTRRRISIQLVCGECGHGSAACDCPASIRPTPLMPYREYLKRVAWGCDGE